MKKFRWMVLFMVLCLIFTSTAIVNAEETNHYERYFQFKKFDSENGLDGTAVNCILAAEDGFLWLGGYSGLQRYDGKEFKTYLINGKALPINDIEEDEDGHFWIATNGEGVFHYNGKSFERIDLGNSEEGSLTVNKILRDSSGNMWIGTREGLFLYDKKLQVIKGLEKADISSFTELDKNRILVIEKTGKLYVVKKKKPIELVVPELEHTGKARCCTVKDDGGLFIGTSKEQILELDKDGHVTSIYEDENLKCINSIARLNNDKYWVCTDSGVGILEGSDLKKIGVPLSDSVEEVCMDYEGNYWFVSSRQGMVQVFNNLFSNLGTYLGISKTVNSIVVHQDNLYIACDDGLYCFHNKDAVHNQLTQMCAGERIRHIYKDKFENLWVSTYYSGIYVMTPDGGISVINKGNGNLYTNQVRCTSPKKNGEILVGTEQGAYVIGENKNVRTLVDDAELNSKRILDVREAANGKIYASTDGHGVFVIDNGCIEKVYTKDQGLLSNIVMKVVPSKRLKGTWFVSGIGINFVSDKGKVTEISDFGMSNVLSLDLLDNGEVLIYAANGLFRLKESDLLKGRYESFKHYERHDGLPIDFTANSWSCVNGNVVYMCGTTGLACIDLDKTMDHKSLKLYVHSISVDGKEIRPKNGWYVLPSDGHRLTIDVRCINYIYQDYFVSYYLDGVDIEPTVIEDSDKSEISYTNLKGGRYKYKFKLLSPDNNKSLGEITIPVHKHKKVIERGDVQLLVAIFVIFLASLATVGLFRLKEKRINKVLAKKYQQEKDEMMERLAYRDMVTGVYNRNLFEEDKKDMDIATVKSVVLMSINHIRYIEQKLGVMKSGEILRYAVEVASNYNGLDPKIYRMTENVFCIVFTDSIEIEDYVNSIKERFAQRGKSENVRLSLAVGAIYNNRVSNETMDTLISRCEKIRLLDERKSEAEFVEGQINLL